MFNGLVEDWVGEQLGIGYAALIVERRIGLPTVRLEADFKRGQPARRPGRAGAAVERLGGASLTLALALLGRDDAEVRMQMRQVIVTTSLDSHRAVAIPADLRAAIERWARPRTTSPVRDTKGAPMQVLLPPGWPRPKGYANGVAASGRQVFIAGMIGWDADGDFHSDDFAEQTRQALQQHRRGAARSRRQARAHRAHDLVRHRQARIPGRRPRGRPGVPRDHRLLQRGDDRGAKSRP